eukprot:NODE_2317_length_945_cov_68.638393_g1907_i0.p2 GENE.NODE_2317_length_945_cov_68.638393_g1907_i0~~NODE_2317_length_945_cov_68.638393_g1907_i0.p2  ORF type:complete len:156 (+),score=40.38 NODE_2317_length_945_cov_68.638393_g1907_i0:394-861(+)
MVPRRAKSAAVIDSIVRSARPGALFLFIDPHRGWITSFREHLLVRSGHAVALLWRQKSARLKRWEMDAEGGLVDATKERREDGTWRPGRYAHFELWQRLPCEGRSLQKKEDGRPRFLANYLRRVADDEAQARDQELEALLLHETLCTRTCQLHWA